jgi:hypothetical protein
LFISYSHESVEHKERVLALAKRLKTSRFDVHLDQYVTSPSQGWPNWMLDQIDDARWVLMVCTETYHRRVRGREEPGRGHGATWEGGIITQTLYEAQARNNKFIPVVFNPKDRSFIPIFVRGSTHYLLDEDYEKLHRHLRGIPPIPVEPAEDLQPRIVQPLPVTSPAAALQGDERTTDLEDTAAPQPLPSHKGATRSSKPVDTKRYAFWTLVPHLHAAGDFERLFHLIETSFLTDQARYLGGFEQGSRDLESSLIPAAIQKGDWARFFHYSILALNLRGIAETLAEPEILRALSRGNHITWAVGFAGLLSDPLDRAEALAAIAESHALEDPERSALIERLRGELDSVPRTSRWTDVEHRTEALCNIGRKLGSDLSGTWGRWITELDLGAKEARQVRRSVAESWIDRGDLQTSKFWERLRSMDDPPALLEIVRDRLRSSQAALPGDALDRLEPLFQGRTDLFDRARALLLAARGETPPVLP